MSMNEQDHLEAAETALDAARERDPGDPEQLGLSALAIAHVLTALLRDTLRPAAVPRPYSPETAAWNVIVRVQETVPAISAGEAVTELTARLLAAGFDPMEDHGEGYHSAQRASDGTWATVISVVSVLVAESGAAARRQLGSELSRAHFVYDERVRPRDWFLSEDPA
jgi:hypothetical protein